MRFFAFPCCQIHLIRAPPSPWCMEKRKAYIRFWTSNLVQFFFSFMATLYNASYKVNAHIQTDIIDCNLSIWCAIETPLLSFGSANNDLIFGSAANTFSIYIFLSLSFLVYVLFITCRCTCIRRIGYNEYIVRSWMGLFYGCIWSTAGFSLLMGLNIGT